MRPVLKTFKHFISDHGGNSLRLFTGSGGAEGSKQGGKVYEERLERTL